MLNKNMPIIDTLFIQLSHIYLSSNSRLFICESMYACTNYICIVKEKQIVLHSMIIL